MGFNEKTTMRIIIRSITLSPAAKNLNQNKSSIFFYSISSPEKKIAAYRKANATHIRDMKIIQIWWMTSNDERVF